MTTKDVFELMIDERIEWRQRGMTYGAPLDNDLPGVEPAAFIRFGDGFYYFSPLTWALYVKTGQFVNPYGLIRTDRCPDEVAVALGVALGLTPEDAIVVQDATDCYPWRRMTPAEHGLTAQQVAARRKARRQLLRCIDSSVILHAERRANAPPPAPMTWREAMWLWGVVAVVVLVTVAFALGCVRIA